MPAVLPQDFHTLTQLLSGFKTYVARFHETTRAGGRVVQNSKGQVWIARPAKFRWQVESPNQQLLIVNGTTYWNYDPDLMQATKATLQQGQGVNAVFLLSGNTKALMGAFVLKKVLHQKQHFIFTLKPKAPSSFDQINLDFKGKALVSMVTNNALGQVSHFSFNDVKLNTALSAHLFTFKPAKGVSVIS